MNSLSLGVLLFAAACSDGRGASGRTASDVCARFKADTTPTPGAGWQLSSMPVVCDQGVLDQAAKDDALRRLNLYRWLAGLPPATADASLEPQEQACALVEDRLPQLSHFPPQSAACYSDAASRAASESNLAKGVSTPADAVDLFLGDEGVPTLGHRRWCLGQGGRTAFGQAGSGTCMFAFALDTPGQPDAGFPFAAWPGPGPQPRAAVATRWSYSANGGALATGATMRVADASGHVLAEGGTVDAQLFGSGPAVSLDVGQPDAGDYDVTVTGTDRGADTYRVTIVECP